ncbi:MAG: putative acyl-CoA transferase/carnitine dehydratase [Dehalococcoidales bacterium]|nr:putative acyl-CoA transferase/carnitine dehydratase [Dehalococcoidales bacterium]
MTKVSGIETALSGIRVIDFGAGGIDPITTSTLADFGAEVIKVESYSKIDFIRLSGRTIDGTDDPNKDVHFARYNQNKYGVLINLKYPKGVALAKRLVSIADVVTENFTVGVLKRLGLGYDELRKVKPDIIYMSSSFGGQEGPYRDFRGHGTHLACMAGLYDLTGWPDDSVPLALAAFADHSSPFLWATVIVAALEHRRQTGRGQFIDASSLEGCIDILDTAIADYSANKRILTRQGNRHSAAAPHGVYRCQGEDRWCAISIFTDEEWQSFGQVMGNPAWAGEERFATLPGRLANADELDQLVEGWTHEQEAEKVMLKLQQAGVAAAVVETARDLYQDPQLAQRGHFWELPEQGMKGYTFEAPAGRLSKTPASLQRSFPLLGEHNEYVFLELLGLDPEEYKTLIKEGVIA